MFTFAFTGTRVNREGKFCGPLAGEPERGRGMDGRQMWLFLVHFTGGHKGFDESEIVLPTRCWHVHEEHAVNVRFESINPILLWVRIGQNEWKAQTDVTNTEA